MNRRWILLPPLTSLLAVGLVALAQSPTITTWITGTGAKPALAVIDFRGAGSQPYMDTFNSTLFGDLNGSNVFDMRPKGMYPLGNPQRPEDLRPSDNNQGFALSDWAGAPVEASHLVFGYTAAQNGVLVLSGWVYDTRQPNVQSAQLMAQRYVGSLDEAGAIKVAHEFANDIITKFGGAGSLLGSRIYYVSSARAGGNTEIWSMSWDGTDQKQMTRLDSLTLQPAISPDGERLAFTTYKQGRPRIMMVSPETGRNIPFLNQDASMNATPSWTPDSARILYSSTASNGLAQIYSAGKDGRGFTRVSHREAIEVEPKANPKNPDVLLFVAGPGGQQIYQMNAQGAQVQRVTNGEGEASNPSWHPDGQHFAFSWTRGYAKGDFNIFVADISNPMDFVQLTHSEGRNENPSWAPDGRHLVFASNRSGRSQIYTMLADGSQVKQLTTQGINRSPVWGTK
jgi:TolB protein